MKTLQGVIDLENTITLQRKTITARNNKSTQNGDAPLINSSLSLSVFQNIKKLSDVMM